MSSPWPFASTTPPLGRTIGCDPRGLLVTGGDLPLLRMDGAGRLAVEKDGDRCIALLSVLCRRPLPSEILRPIEAAAAYWAAGDKALANLRLVFSDLPKLEEPSDLHRLQAAAWCLDQGLAPRDLMTALDLDPSVLDLRKYDPDQPRVRAGSGRESGRWTDQTDGAASDGPFVSSSEPQPVRVAASGSSHILLAATTTNFEYACKKLGLDTNAASDALHDAKYHAKLGGVDTCVFDLETGDIFFQGEHIGNLGD